MKFIHYLMAISQFAIENGTLHSGFTMIYQVNMMIFHSKSYILIGISLVNHPFWVAPMTMETPRSSPLRNPAKHGTWSQPQAETKPWWPRKVCSSFRLGGFVGDFRGFPARHGGKPPRIGWFLWTGKSHRERFLDDDWTPMTSWKPRESLRDIPRRYNTWCIVNTLWDMIGYSMI